jgi:hypothetical protein
VRSIPPSYQKFLGGFFSNILKGIMMATSQPNKKLREGHDIGMGIKAPIGVPKEARKGKVTPKKQDTKLKQPKGGY